MCRRSKVARPPVDGADTECGTNTSVTARCSLATMPKQRHYAGLRRFVGCSRAAAIVILTFKLSDEGSENAARRITVISSHSLQLCMLGCAVLLQSPH
jgi:hypothetical protein